MAGYLKLWTTLSDNENFLSLSGSQRGLYIQILLAIKKGRDDGTVGYSSWVDLGSATGIEGKTARKNLDILQENSLLTYTTNSNKVILIKVPNYKHWQGIDVHRVREKVRKKSGKIPPLRPDQTRPKQTRPDHLSSPDKSGDHKEAIEYWCSKYLDTFKIKYDFRSGKDGMAVKRLLATFGLEVLCQIIDRMFTSDDPFYRTGGGRTLTVLSANANKLAQELARQDSFLDQLSEAGRATYLAGQEVLRARKQRRKDTPDSNSV